jgi:hypothetical protein
LEHDGETSQGKKEVVGIYQHPLDDYKFEKYFCNAVEALRS